MRDLHALTPFEAAERRAKRDFGEERDFGERDFGERDDKIEPVEVFEGDLAIDGLLETIGKSTDESLFFQSRLV